VLSKVLDNTAPTIHDKSAESPSITMDKEEYQGEDDIKEMVLLID